MHVSYFIRIGSYSICCFFFDDLQSFFKIESNALMSDLPKCPKCGSEYTYENGLMYVCPECGHEWGIHAEEKSETAQNIVKDAHGNILQDGDSVTIIKDIKVKGSSSVLKVGVKVKNIRLVEDVNGHNIEAKVPGFGIMMLKSEIVKKCN